ncbi:MAG: GGDEF domain-containing protein [Microthrixaceae bacterium]
MLGDLHPGHRRRTAGWTDPDRRPRGGADAGRGRRGTRRSGRRRPRHADPGARHLPAAGGPRPADGAAEPTQPGRRDEGLLERGDPYSLAFCDLDHFKELNDLHGHDAGDRALRSFARTLTESLRPQDVICRWGGEEFVIVLPDCDAAAAVEAMERVRTNLLLTSMSAHTVSFTASFGVATSADGATFDDVVALADLALREAKGTGRDRVIRFDSLPSTVGERSTRTSSGS